jgi:hypothetical protein
MVCMYYYSSWVTPMASAFSLRELSMCSSSMKIRGQRYLQCCSQCMLLWSTSDCAAVYTEWRVAASSFGVKLFGNLKASQCFCLQLKGLQVSDVFITFRTVMLCWEAKRGSSYPHHTLSLSDGLPFNLNPNVSSMQMTLVCMQHGWTIVAMHVTYFKKHEFSGLFTWNEW